MSEALELAGRVIKLFDATVKQLNEKDAECVRLREELRALYPRINPGNYHSTADLNPTFLGEPLSYWFNLQMELAQVKAELLDARYTLLTEGVARNTADKKAEHLEQDRDKLRKRIIEVETEHATLVKDSHLLTGFASNGPGIFKEVAGKFDALRGRVTAAEGEATSLRVRAEKAENHLMAEMQTTKQFREVLIEARGYVNVKSPTGPLALKIDALLGEKAGG